ncbi:MAG: tetratricopeptide repeat protein [Vicinamibacterales bacterium]
MSAQGRRVGRRAAAWAGKGRVGYRCAAAWLLLLGLSAPAAAQGFEMPGLATARQAAEKALVAGQYDLVEQLGQPFADDDGFAVLRARALAARGRYDEASDVLGRVAREQPGGDAALELGLLQIDLGRRREGRRMLQLLLLAQGRGQPTAVEYARAARASRALGRFEDANNFYREAVADQPNDPAINTAWGDLFLEKHNNQDAVRSYQAALRATPDYAPAILGMARALADDNPPAAEAQAKKALAINPSDVGAHLVLAGLSIDEDKRDEAKAAIDRALAINPRSLEALSLQAAVAYVEGRTADYEAAVKQALAINPIYGEAYRVVGEVTARYYRFDEAATLVQQAIGVDRENARSHADLGAHLMRTGDESGARRSLEVAFRIDPYDVVTFNLLGLLDTLEGFETFRDGDLVVKLHKDEAPVMKEYAPQLARQALEDLSEKWQFTPRGPILVELFPRHDDFAVRTVGLPGMLGALGACFGRVVTLDSPKARPPGTFNWGSTLWHEMAHVITLQLSDQRIPRWLTEGISVWEERRASDAWGRETEIPFAQALAQDQTLSLRDLNAGFQNPATISLAYYQASLLVEHIVGRFGEAKLRALVASFADGLDMDEAITRTLGVDIDDLQASFTTFLGERFGTLRRALAAPEGLEPGLPVSRLKALADANPGSMPAQMAYAQAVREENPAAALEAFARAAALVPQATGPESPNAQIAEIAMGRGDTARAIAALDTLTQHDHSDVESARLLVKLLKDTNAAEPVLRTALSRVVAVDPFDAPSHTALGRMALDAGEPGDAVRDFRVAIAAGPIDRAGAHADLAEALIAAGQPADAKREALNALEIAPTYERAQDLLLKLVEGGR